MSNNYEKSNNKGFSLSSVFLIILGVVFLLNNFGVLPWEIWQNIWKFWPILLILFGIEAILGRKSSPRSLVFLLILIFLIPLILILNPLTGNPLSNSKINLEKPLGNLTKASVNFELPSSNIKINSLEPNSGSSLKGVVSYSTILPKPLLTDELRFGQAKYTLSQPEKYIPFLNNIGNSVDLNLSRLIPFEISIKSNTGVFNFNFTDLKIELLEIDSTAGQINITFPKASSSKAYIRTSASLITLTIPSESGSSIKTNSSLRSIKIDDKRFSKKEQIFQSNNWESALNKIQIEINGQATNLEVR